MPTVSEANVQPLSDVAKEIKMNMNKPRPPIDFVTLNKEMIKQASEIVKESKIVITKPKPKRNIHDVLKANGDQHDKIPRNIFEYAVNYGRSPQPQENKSLTFIRKSMKLIWEHLVTTQINTIYVKRTIVFWQYDTTSKEELHLLVKIKENIGKIYDFLST